MFKTIVPVNFCTLLSAHSFANFLNSKIHWIQLKCPTPYFFHFILHPMLCLCILLFLLLPLAFVCLFHDLSLVLEHPSSSSGAIVLKRYRYFLTIHFCQSLIYTSLLSVFIFCLILLLQLKINQNLQVSCTTWNPCFSLSVFISCVIQCLRCLGPWLSCNSVKGNTNISAIHLQSWQTYATVLANMGHVIYCMCLTPSPRSCL